ncbi:MAG: hypothetical protein PHW87_00940 [Methanothrix sp.]|nr:hypothetical protein [Methanothrix sp.]
MALRLIEISLPKDKLQAVEEMVGDRSEVLDIIMQQAANSWKIPIRGELKTRLSTDYILIRMLVLAEASQSLLNLLLSDKYLRTGGILPAHHFLGLKS